MSWKTIGGIAAAVCAFAAVSQAGKVLKGDDVSLTTTQFDAAVTAQIKAMNEQTPKDMVIEGEPLTLLKVQLAGRKITYTIQANDKDHDWDNVDKGDREVARAGSAASLCTGGSTRNLLNRNYALVYRYHDHIGKFRGEQPAITVADCKNVT